jgi:tRNA-binding protein
MDQAGPTNRDAEVLPTADVAGFFQYDLRVGTVVACRVNARARVPALVLTVDFGPLGTRVTSAQLTRRYRPADLEGRQVVAVVNFPVKNIAGVQSAVLVLGGLPEPGDVVLLRPDERVPNGTKIG